MVKNIFLQIIKIWLPFERSHQTELKNVFFEIIQTQFLPIQTKNYGNVEKNNWIRKNKIFFLAQLYAYKLGVSNLFFKNELSIFFFLKFFMTSYFERSSTFMNVHVQLSFIIVHDRSLSFTIVHYRSLSFTIVHYRSFLYLFKNKRFHLLIKVLLNFIIKNILRV